MPRLLLLPNLESAASCAHYLLLYLDSHGPWERQAIVDVYSLISFWNSPLCWTAVSTNSSYIWTLGISRTLLHLHVLDNYSRPIMPGGTAFVGYRQQYLIQEICASGVLVDIQLR